MLERIQNGYNKLSQGALVLSGIFLVAMMAYGFATVSGRFLFSLPIAGLFEFTELAMVFVAFLAMSACQVERRHMRVDFVLIYVNDKAKPVFDIIAYVCGIVCCVLLASRAMVYAMDSWTRREVTWGIIEFPVYPSKFIVTVGTAILIGQLLLDLLSAIKTYRINRKG